ncbi:MAG: dTMP kinase, partial [Candidatus Acidiferrum sp.]
TCVDPGGTEIGDALRELLLRRASPIGVRCEAMLFMASRAQLVAQVIEPALDAGHIVIADRFLLANVVYQGHAGGLDPAELWRMGDFATAGLRPDLTFVLDLPPEAARARRARSPDRIEKRDAAYHERVRAGFLAEAERNPLKMRVIDAVASVESVHQAICGALAKMLSIA